MLKLITKFIEYRRLCKAMNSKYVKGKYILIKDIDGVEHVGLYEDIYMMIRNKGNKVLTKKFIVLAANGKTEVFELSNAKISHIEIL